MINDAAEAKLVARLAREWRDRLRRAPGFTLSFHERAELAHVLHELQYLADTLPPGHFR